MYTETLLHTPVVKHGYLSYCHLPAILYQSGFSPLTSLINKVFYIIELLLKSFFCLFHHSLRLFSVKIPGDQQFLRYSKILSH